MTYWPGLPRELSRALLLFCLLLTASLSGQGYERLEEIDNSGGLGQGIRSTIILPDNTIFYRNDNGVGRLDEYGQELWYHELSSEIGNITIDTLGDLLWAGRSLRTTFINPQISVRAERWLIKASGAVVARDTLSSGLLSDLGYLPINQIMGDGGGVVTFSHSESIAANSRADSLHLVHFNDAGVIVRDISIGFGVGGFNLESFVDVLADGSYLFLSRVDFNHAIDSPDFSPDWTAIHIQPDGTYSVPLGCPKFRPVIQDS